LTTDQANHDPSDDGSRREHVADEQLRMVLSHTQSATLIATGFALVMAAYAHGSTPRHLVSAWVVAKLAIALLRMSVAWAYQRRGQPPGLPWRRAVYALLAVDGAVWGVAGLALMSEPEPLAALVAAALACVTCIATFGLQVRVVATAAYALPILLPTAAGLALRGDEFGLLGAGGLVLVQVVQLVTARRAERRFAAAVSLRLQAEALAQEKESALQLARQQSAAKAQFLANISHELRTPLHGILGLARLLHIDARDPEVLHRLQLIEASGTHLLTLINDLLDVSRSETGRFVLRDERFDLSVQAAFVADVFAVRAADKGLAFTLTDRLPRPCWVTGDAARLRQVLHNLLGNALKFTTAGSIALTLERPQADGPVRIEVRDTGVGIPSVEQARIFQAFHQVGGGTAEPSSGAGLGLTITREIAHAMGGEITLESRPGEGSCFVFTAPLPPASARPAAPAEAPSPDAMALRRVLVAEDDDVNALIIGAYLAQLGIACERVHNGREAVGHALREIERPELVLMDWRMPVMDGVSATREIRVQERALGLPRLPIVALTATASPDDRRLCIDSGMDDFLAKPYTEDALKDVLRRWGGAAR